MIKQIKSFAYAFRGILYALLNEGHMRFHLVAAAFVIFFGALFDLSAAEWTAVCIAIALVIGLELVNTAVECVCDVCCKEENPLIKAAKDSAAGAVLVAAAVSVAVACFVFIKPQKIAAVYSIFIGNPLYIALLFTALCLGILFIAKFRIKRDSDKNRSKK